MQLFGVIEGGNLVITGSGHGKPVELTDPPEPVDGYEAVSGWHEDELGIRQVWSLVATREAVAEAAIELAHITAKTIGDADALKVPALYPSWEAGTPYEAGDRVVHGDALYRALQSHTSQADWAPDAAHSLFARVLTEGPGGEPDTPPEWVQPDSVNPYAKGDRVTHQGAVWVSLVDGNVWEPGASWSTGIWQREGA